MQKNKINTHTSDLTNNCAEPPKTVNAPKTPSQTNNLLRNAYSYLQTALFHEHGPGVCEKCGAETFYRERSLCLNCLKAECERELGLSE